MTKSSQTNSVKPNRAKGRRKGSVRGRPGKKKPSQPAQPVAKDTPAARGRNPKTIVTRLLEIVQGKIEKNELKASMSDVIRLVQLNSELNQETPAEIKVTWVEPEEEKSGTEA